MVSLESKKITIRLPKDLVKKMKYKALDTDTNLTNIIIAACYQYLNKK